MTMTGGILGTTPVDALFVPTGQPVFLVKRARKRALPKRIVAVALTGIVLLAPLPVASNHPVMWLIWVVVIGLVGVIYTFAPTTAIRRDAPASAIVALGLGFLVFVLWQASPLPFANSITPRASLLAVIRNAGYLAFFVLMLRIAAHRRIGERISQVMFWGFVLQGLLAMILLKLPVDDGILMMKSAYQGAATGTFINKNSFATFLGMGLILGMTLLQKTRFRRYGSAIERMQTGAVALGLLIILIALVNTQSRMGLAATLIATLAVALINSVRLNFMVTSLAGALVVIVIYGQNLLERFVTVSQSGVTRLDLYGQVFGMIRERPLTGFGLDSFPLAFQQFHRAPVTAGFVWDKAHSSYLTLWAETGIIAGSLPVIAGVLALVVLWRRACRSDAMAQAGFGALLLCGVHSLVDFSLEIQANMFVLLTFVALGLARIQKDKGY